MSEETAAIDHSEARHHCRGPGTSGQESVVLSLLWPVGFKSQAMALLHVLELGNPDRCSSVINNKSTIFG